MLILFHLYSKKNENLGFFQMLEMKKITKHILSYYTKLTSVLYFVNNYYVYTLDRNCVLTAQ